MLRFILRIGFGALCVAVFCTGVFWLLVVTGAWSLFLEGWEVATRNGMPWD